MKLFVKKNTKNEKRKWNCWFKKMKKEKRRTCKATHSATWQVAQKE